MDITPSDTRIITITMATTAPALLALDFVLSLPPLLPPLLVVVLGVPVVALVGGASDSSLVLNNTVV